jgi:uncharacterized protein with LGFP repeats
VPGLTNGTRYTFTVVAHSVAGDSDASASASVIPGTPKAPTNVQATAGNTKATVQWVAADANGASGITYTVTATGGATPLTMSVVNGTSMTFPGLTNGTSYTFTVVANGTAGATPVSSDNSAPSNAIIPVGVPNAPTIVSAIPGNVEVTVSWSAPATDPARAAVTGYRVIPSAGQAVEVPAGTTSVPVPGLTNGTRYTFTVVAHSVAGDSAASAPVDATPTNSPVWAHYLAIGGEAVLGHPLGAEFAPTTHGLAQEFKNGSIYWTRATGAHLVWGDLLAKYKALRGPAGVLGYPTTDETATLDGVGRYNHFAGAGGASIYWTPKTGAHAVYGAIRARWASLGWERGRLGYPTTDEFGVPGGRRNEFVGGEITWQAAKKTTVVKFR